VSINPAEISGDIYLRISFIDATDTLVPSFSLDGGSTFVMPFDASAARFAETGGASWTLGADPAQAIATLPSGLHYLAFGIVMLGSLVALVRLRCGLLPTTS
jgi:hypothetical protein